MREYSVTFGTFTAIYVKAPNADRTIKIAKVLDPEMARLCISRRQAVTARRVAK